MNQFILSQEEYLEFLNYKKEKLLKEVDAIDELIAKAISPNGAKTPPTLQPLFQTNEETSHNGNGDSRAARGSVGWKYIIDEIFKTHTEGLTPNEVADIASKRSDVRMPKETARKSVWSTLLSNSAPKKDRYYAVKEKGRKVWRLNKDFKE
jgi:hypothetical protein